MNALDKSPYRAHGLPPSPCAYVADVLPTKDEDIAKVVAFIWATALLRFVFVVRRDEPLTADPLFAALLTFGIPGVLLIVALMALAKRARVLVRSFFVPSQICER